MNSRKKSSIFFGTLIGVIIAFTLFVCFIYFSNYSNGSLIRPYGIRDINTPYMNGVRDDFDNLLKQFSDHVSLLTSTFGFISFLIAYQNKNNILVSDRAWGLLVVGVILLVTSLILSLFGKELLLRMAIRNSVDIGNQALEFSRMANYFCFIGAAVCIAFYTIELTLKISFTSPSDNSKK
jgi:hypothetical protein